MTCPEIVLLSFTLILIEFIVNVNKFIDNNHEDNFKLFQNRTYIIFYVLSIIVIIILKDNRLIRSTLFKEIIVIMYPLDSVAVIILGTPRLSITITINTNTTINMKKVYQYDIRIAYYL